MKKILILNPDETDRYLKIAAMLTENIDLINYEKQRDNLCDLIKTKQPDIVFIDETFHKAIEICDNSLKKLPETNIVVKLSKNNRRQIDRFLESGPKSILIELKKKHNTTKNPRNLLEELKNGLIIVDSSPDIDIELRLLMHHAGYSIYEASNITETLYYMKSKNITTVYADKSVIQKNHNFLNSLLSISEKYRQKRLKNDADVKFKE